MARPSAGLALVAALALVTACARPSAVLAPTPAQGLPAGNEAPPARVAFRIPLFAAAPPPAPISLTTTDGAGLELLGLSSTTEVYGPVAHTEMRLRFSNPEARTREGRFSIKLPPHALVTRLAMKIDGRFTEADVAETARAREVYEDVVHRRRDPLLVEQHGTNELSARVFPILPNGEKEIVVGWVAEVGPSSPVVVPLRGLPAIAALDVTVRDDETTVAAQSSKGVAPTSDLRVPVSGEAPSTIRAGDLVLARVTVPRASFEQASSPIDRGAIVLVDTSASRATDLEEDLARLRGVIRELAREEPRAALTVAAFDQGVEVAYRGTLHGFDDVAIARLRAHGALGASDPKGALEWAASEAASARASRVVIVSDGLATGGPAGPAVMRGVARSLQDAGIERLDAIAVGDVRDESTLRALVGAGFRTPGAVLEGGTNAEAPPALAARLTRAVRSAVAVVAPGAVRVWPRTLDGVQPGDDVHVLVQEAPRNPVTAITIGASSVPIRAVEDHVAIPRELVEKVDATARIAALAEGANRAGWTDTARAQAVSIAKAKKVASPFTSFVVLETEEDRRALLGAAPPRARGHVAAPVVVNAPVPALAPAPTPASAPPAPASAPTAPIDGLFAPPPPVSAPSPKPAATAKIELRGHVAKPVAIRMGVTTVFGRLPPEIIQRVVRQNFGRFRACYEEGLRRRGPKLAGRVETRFVIGRDGAVRESLPLRSELGDRDVEACVARAFSGLVFPTPEGGVIDVHYPIVFRPAGSEDAEEEARSRMPSPIQPRVWRSPFERQLEPSDEAYPPLLAWRGDYLEARRALSRDDVAKAVEIATAARAKDASDVLALIALGEALHAAQQPELAQRAFGSIADLSPNDAARLRSTAVRLEAAAGRPTALSLELLRRAAADRPDLPHGHHELAVALLHAGAHGEAFDVLAAALGGSYVPRLQQGVALLRRDLQLVTSAWIAAEPSRADAIKGRARAALGHPFVEETTPSVTYALSWETDASALALVVPVTAEHIAWANDGYGPDAWVVRGEDGERSPIPVVVQSRRHGPSGHPFGVVHVMEHDGRGHVTVEPRPFVLMNEGAQVSLGVSR
ncbi:MAG: AgmX/PglI C-terminal domain-containing protein [Deltaproteobacteria bacterium]|nr:AgmX/PglI C-terminal domain-containing protein [Deltaproteobacteria bacterium]